MQKTDEVNPRVGLLGELAVEMELVQRGWHPVRLDTAQMASNADLLAVNRQQRVSIQVKATKKQPRSQWLQFGYATGYLRAKTSPTNASGAKIFNAKDSPLIADVVVSVMSDYPGASRFVVMPVAFAEALCRLHCDYWSSVPAKTVTGKRSDSFPIYLCFEADLKTHAHAKHHELIKRNILKFEDAWDVLSETVSKLHDPKRWPLLR
jgi:hypothetical protein